MKIHCNTGCMVKPICQENISLTLETSMRNKDIGSLGCILEKLIKNILKNINQIK